MHQNCSKFSSIALKYLVYHPLLQLLMVKHEVKRQAD